MVLASFLVLLVIAFVLAGAGFAATWPSVQSRFPRLERLRTLPTNRLLAGLCLLMGLLAAFTLRSYTDGGSSPSARKVNRLRHEGFAFDSGSITLAGSDPADGKVGSAQASVVVPALGEKAALRLTPNGSLDSWRVRASSLETPVRLGGSLVNPVIGDWFEGEELYGFAWKSPLGRHVSASFRFSANRGAVKAEYGEGEQWTEIKYRGRELRLQDHITLGDLLSSDPDFLDKARKQLGHTPVVLVDNDAAAARALSSTYLVREKRGELTSKVGLLVIGDLEGVTLTRNGLKRSFDAGAADFTVSGLTPTLAIGDDESAAFRLPAKAINVSGRSRLELRFARPASYPLPPPELDGAKTSLLLSTVSTGLPVDGYLFETGNSLHPIYAKLRFANGFTGVELLDKVFQSTPGKAQGQAVKEGASFVVSDGEVGVIGSFYDPRTALSPPTWLPAAAFLLSGLLMAALCWLYLGNLEAIELSLFGIWLSALGLATVRCILSFRAAVLPPMNADLSDQARFVGAWTIACGGALIPLLVSGVGFFAARRLAVRSSPRLRRQAERSGKLPRGTDPLQRLLQLDSFAILFVACIVLWILSILHVLHLMDASRVGPIQLAITVSVAVVLRHLLRTGTAGLKSLREDWSIFIPLAVLVVASIAAQAVLGGLATIRTSIGAFLVVVFCTLGLVLRLSEIDRGEAPPEPAGGMKTKLAGSVALEPLLGRKKPNLRPSDPVTDAKRQHYKSQLRRFTVLLLATLVPLVLIDMGAFLYIVPLALALGLLWRPTVGTSKGYWAVTLSCLLAVAVLLVIPGPKDVLIGRMTGIDRMQVQLGRSSSLLTHPGGRVDATKILEIEQQRWAMLTYAGAPNGGPIYGYGDAPLSSGGMTYRTMLSDAVFSVFVLGEHGWFVGGMVALLYALLFASCQLGAWALGYEVRRWTFVLLTLIGAYYATHGIYMALANLWLVPFTGQNMPFLSIASTWDVLQSAILLPLATHLLLTDVAPMTVGFRRMRAESRGSRAAFWLPQAIGIVGVFVVAIAASRLPGNSVRSYRMPEEAVSYLQAKVDSGALKLDGGLSARSESSEPLTPIERLALRRYNAQLDKTSREGGLLYAEPKAADSEQMVLRVDPSAFRVPSPLASNDGVAWRGDLVLRGSGAQPRLLYLSRPTVLSLGNSGAPQAVDLDSTKPLAPRSQKLQFFRRGDSGNQSYPTVYREGDSVVINAPIRRPRYTVSVNGEPLGSGFGTERKLQADDVVTIEDSQGGSSRRYQFLFLGSKPSKLASVLWINGRYTRVFEPGYSLPVAVSIGKLGDEMVQQMIDAGYAPDAVDKMRRRSTALSMDDSLTRAVDSDLLAFCREMNSDPKDPATPFAGVTVMDSFSGEILAMAGAPRLSPAEKSDVKTNGSRERVAALSDWNFKNHVIGSTVKPLTFASLSHALHGAPLAPNFDLANLVVHEGSPAHTTLGGIGITVRGRDGGREPLICGPAGSHPMDDYITYSETWVAAVTAALGLVTDKADVGTLVRPGGDFTVGGKSYDLDLTKNPTFLVRKAGKYTVTSDIYRSLLFQSLADCYGVVLQSSDQGRWSRKDRQNQVASFLPSFAGAAGSSAVDYALPDPVLFDGSEFSDFRGDLVSFMIGGGNNRWNNVQLATAFSRLATGQMVTPTLEARTDAKPFDAFGPNLAPLNELPWRDQHLFGPMGRARTDPRGTAHPITTNFGRYRAIFKTGTLGSQLGTTESEALVFVVGEYRGNTGFVPGRTVTGYVFLDSSKQRSTRQQRHRGVRFKLANPVLRDVVKYLDRTVERFPG